MIKQKVIGIDDINELISCTLEVSFLCDKKCPYCYNPLLRYDGVDKRPIWNELMNVKGPLQILMLGGETTLYKESINFFNEFSLKYNNDLSKHLVYFTHGNNNPNVYKKFIGYNNDQIYMSFSYHGSETDNNLWFKNLQIVLSNNIKVVCCLLVSNNTSNWKEYKDILLKARKLGCETDINIEVNKNNIQKGNVEYYEYFKEFIYNKKTISDIVFSKNNINIKQIKRSDYFKNFPFGLSSIKKLCFNRVFKIDPNGILTAECGEGVKIDLSNNPNLLHNHMKQTAITCNSTCTGIANTLNTKLFFTKDITKI